MAKKKIKRKELLKEPDEFLTFSARMLQWMAQNRDRILWGVGVVMFIAAAVSGWVYYRKIKEDRAVAAFGKIMTAYRQMGEDAASDPQAGRVKEMLAAFVDDYAGTGSGRMARVLLANLYFRTGDPDAAIMAYRRALEDYEDHPLIQNLILSGLGHAYLKKGQSDEAARYFQRVAAGDAPLLKSEALFILAQLSGKSGNPGDTAVHLKKILSEFPGSLHAVLAKEALGGAE